MIKTLKIYQLGRCFLSSWDICAVQKCDWFKLKRHSLKFSNLSLKLSFKGFYIAFKLNRCYLMRIAIKIGHFYAGSGRQLGNLPLVPNGLHARIHRNSIQSQLLSNPGSWGRFNWVWGPLWAILQIRPHSSLPSSVLMCVQLLLEQGWAQPFRHNNVRVSLRIVSLVITLTGGKYHSG